MRLPVCILVIGNPEAPELQALRRKMPEGAVLLGIGQTLQDFSYLSEEQWASVEVVVKMGGGSSIAAAKWQKEHGHLHRCNSSSVSLTLPLEDFWPKLTGLRWLHSGAVGLEHLLNPALVCSSVVVTNARSVYSYSLAEYAMLCCQYFAKNVPRFLEAQQQWDVFETEELREKPWDSLALAPLGIELPCWLVLMRCGWLPCDAMLTDPSRIYRAGCWQTCSGLRTLHK